MKRCDYCGKAAEYDGQPHGIEDCAEHMRLENARLRQQVENVRGLIPYWERVADETEEHTDGKLIALMHRGAIEAVKMALQAGAEDTSDEG